MLQLDSESESALTPEDESASEDAPPAREIPLLEETSDQGDGPSQAAPRAREMQAPRLPARFQRYMRQVRSATQNAVVKLGESFLSRRCVAVASRLGGRLCATSTLINTTSKAPAARKAYPKPQVCQRPNASCGYNDGWLQAWMTLSGGKTANAAPTYR